MRSFTYTENSSSRANLRIPCKDIFYVMLNKCMPVTVAERAKACTVFARSETGTVGSDLFPVRYELNSYILFLYTAGHGSRAV
jgi:hypothetical protein